MFKRFKAFLNKDGFEYFEGLIDPFQFHSTFYNIMVLFKIIDVERNNRLRWLNQNAVIFVTGFIGIILTILSLYHGVETANIPYMTEAGTYCLILSYEILILSCTKRNLPQYLNLLQAMKHDFFYICTEGENYRDKYFNNQLVTWKICIYACIFTLMIGVGAVAFSSSSLLLFLITQQPGEEGSRPILFPLWLPNVDLGKTPFYEIAFVYVNITCILYAYNYIFMLQTQIVWIRHITSKVDIIIWSLENLLDDIYPSSNAEQKAFFSNLIKERMRKIVIHHQQMLSVLGSYATVYKKLLMFEQKCCGPVICLTAYCTAEKLDKGEFQPILPLLSIGTTVMYFIPSYFCTFLANKVSSICDACWSIPFWNASPGIRPYMVLIMQRSLRPIPLCAPAFEPFTLQTFAKKMTSAYSLFNMLRQANL